MSERVENERTHSNEEKHSSIKVTGDPLPWDEVSADQLASVGQIGAELAAIDGGVEKLVIGEVTGDRLASGSATREKYTAVIARAIDRVLEDYAPAHIVGCNYRVVPVDGGWQYEGVCLPVGHLPRTGAELTAQLETNLGPAYEVVGLKMSSGAHVLLPGVYLR